MSTLTKIDPLVLDGKTLDSLHGREDINRDDLLIYYKDSYCLFGDRVTAATKEQAESILDAESETYTNKEKMLQLQWLGYTASVRLMQMADERGDTPDPSLVNTAWQAGNTKYRGTTNSNGGTRKTFLDDLGQRLLLEKAAFIQATTQHSAHNGVAMPKFMYDATVKGFVMATDIQNQLEDHQYDSEEEYKKFQKEGDKTLNDIVRGWNQLTTDKDHGGLPPSSNDDTLDQCKARQGRFIWLNSAASAFKFLTESCAPRVGSKITWSG